MARFVGPIWGRQDPGGPHVGPMSFAVWETITEEGRHTTHPQETEDSIADYFEELYQARKGAPEYGEWTKLINETVQGALKQRHQEEDDDNEINMKELNTVIKKLKSKKYPRTRQNPQWNLHKNDPREHWNKAQGTTRRNPICYRICCPDRWNIFI